MPAEGIKLINHEDILSFDEIIEVCKTATSLGVSKIRITGGEPLVRKGILDLVKSISQIEGVKDLSMTTNGILLTKFASDLKQAGLNRVNISLDTLDPDEYKRVTRGGEITQVIQGIVAAKKADLLPVKLNAVIYDRENTEMKEALKQFAKDLGVQIRFISQMHLETGEFSVVEGGIGGDCSICNRIRLTANGYIKPCLFSDDQYSVRELGPKNAILKAVQFKPKEGIVCSKGDFYNIGG
jgi:cyclic pyranopterin phosphate synthase